MSRIDDLIAELCPDGVEYRTLGGLLAYEQPTRYLVSSKNYNPTFETPVLTAGKTFILGHTNEATGVYQATKEAPTVIFDDFTTAFKWVNFPFKVKSTAMKLLPLRPGSQASLRFVWYAMQTVRYAPQDHSRQWIATYSRFTVPLPPLTVQREIVRVLDKFTKLEAELEARRKQYEHYRDRLLTFEEKPA